MDTLQELQTILEQTLSNKSLITPEVMGASVADTKEIVKDRELALPFFLDIATYRFFVRVNAKAPENITNSYKEALKRLKSAPLSKSKNALAVVSKRGSIWI